MTAPLPPTPNSPEHVPRITDSASHRRLDRSLMHGVAWTAGVKWLSQILSWPATIFVARLLSPDDFGIVAMASVYIGLVALVNEFGLGSAIIRERSLTERQAAQISGLCVLLGSAAFLLSAVLARPLSIFYHTPALTAVVLALSANFIITGFKTVPLSLLQRDFKFRELATNEAVGAVIQSLMLVLLAWLGFSYWSLVIGSLVASLMTTLLSYYQSPHRLAWPRFGDIKEEVRFGSHLVGSRIAWYLYTNADFFVIGRMLGKTPLGNYSIGWDFATMPVEKVTGLVGRVAPPVFSAVQHDRAALRRYLSKLSGGIALLTVPAGLGLALVAHDFITIALGEKWLAAVVPLQLLAVYACFRSLVPLVAQVGQIVGMARYVMRNSFIAACVMPVSFFIGAHWGTVGVATAWILVYPMVSVPMCIAIFRRIDMGVREYLRALWPSLSSGALMIVAVLLLQYRVTMHLPVVARFSIEVGVGALVYAASMWALHKREVQSLVSTIRSASAR